MRIWWVDVTLSHFRVLPKMAWTQEAPHWRLPEWGVGIPQAGDLGVLLSGPHPHVVEYTHERGWITTSMSIEDAALIDLVLHAELQDEAP